MMTVVADSDRGREQPSGPPLHAGRQLLALYPAREYFRREGVVMGEIVVIFLLQALALTLLVDHAGWRVGLAVALAAVAWLAGPLFFSRSQVRRWWREAGEGPCWRGGDAVHVSAVDHLVMVAVMEAVFLPMAIYGGALVWSLLMGFMTAAGVPMGLSRAIAKEERSRNEVLLVGLHRRSPFQIQVPELWLRGQVEEGDRQSGIYSQDCRALPAWFRRRPAVPVAWTGGGVP